MRDCQILRIGDTYYMTGTSKPFFIPQGQNPGVKLWKSPDLLHWTEVATLVKRDPDRWYRQRFWAPEIFPYKRKAWDGDRVGLEGPTFLLHDGTYYLLYSSWGRGYELGYAAAPSIRGPWTKYPGNPIYGAQKLENTQRYGTTYTQVPDVPFTEVAHGSPFTGPDGTLWFSCHGYLKNSGGNPHLVIAPLTFDKQGVIHLKLTWTPQRVPLADDSTPTTRPTSRRLSR